MLSYWEKQSLLHYDVIIIGAGIVGLSTALSIREKDASKRVLVTERAILPTGASTKNAGFACIGSLTEILDDLTYMNQDEVLRLVDLRYRGLNRLRNRLGDKHIGYSENGSFELITEKEEDCLNRIEEVNNLLQPVLNSRAFSICSERISRLGFHPAHCRHLVQNHLEGELHTGQMMRTLIDRCIGHGIEIKTGCEVKQIDETSTGVNVIVQHGYLNEEVVFTGGQVAVCTNSFTSQLFPGLDIKPGRGQVLITKPVKGLKFKGIYHFEKGFYYFRELDGRVLLGGGRNLDFDGEQSTEFAFNEKIRQELLNKLSEIILPEQPFEVEDWWTGIMAFGETKFPILKQTSERIYMGVRLGGMGVAMGSELGQQLADKMHETKA